ncbi:MAG: hypothetical protein H6624_04110 [Bdellovibrionaceae bacterium]|nr:hypothetical protein [Bdellovibrionales bacterium]MCB9083499.1 hypothetical protein [Pseudobdellovibrionaceae bacterium]
MGIMNTLLDFLFGKNNDIFDENGQVRHNLPQNKWDAWQQRYQSSPEYNWKNHSGMKAKEKKSSHR